MHRLVHIETKTIKGVKDQLDKNEIVEKIKQADKFIDKLKYGDNSISQRDIQYFDLTLKKNAPITIAASNVNFLQSIREASIPVDAHSSAEPLLYRQLTVPLKGKLPLKDKQ